MSAMDTDISKGIEKHKITIARSSSLNISNTSVHPVDFVYVKTNIPGPGCDVEDFSGQFVGCRCQDVCQELCQDVSQYSCSCLQHFGLAYSADGRLSSDYLLSEFCRPILECGADCDCGEECHNRLVQKGVVRSLSVFQTPGKGFGLKVSDDGNLIPPYCFVCEYAGEVLGQDEAKKRVAENEEEKKDNYVIALREAVGGRNISTCIDPSKKGNLGRFINHSCDPNLVMIPVRINHSVPRLALFSRRKINAGEELTFDYSGKSFFTVSNCSSFSQELEFGSLQKKRNLDSDIQHEVKKVCYDNVSNNVKNTELDIGSCDEFKDSKENNSIQNKDKSISEIENDCEPVLVTNKNKTNTSTYTGTNCGSSQHRNFKRRVCLCGSKNCQKVLPFDADLF